MRLPRLVSVLLFFGAGTASAAPGFLVVAPDRGFSGNEAVRDTFSTFAVERPAELVFVTRDGTADRMDQAYASLRKKKARPVVVLPFYLTAAHADTAQIEAWVQDKDAVAGRPFGRSFPAVAALGERLLDVEKPMQTHLVLVGHGAETASQAEVMQQDLRRMLLAAAGGLNFTALDVRVWPYVDGFPEEDYRRQLAVMDDDGTARVVVLPFHLGPNLDSMMGFTPQLRAAAPEGITVLGPEAALQAALSRWLTREAARYRTLEGDQIGVVVHAHGSDWQWNETMRQGAAPLGDDYLVEYAFSMGDPATLEHAVRHLEERGAEAVVIVRVFGMESSFRDGIVQFIGEAWETCQPFVSTSHDHGHGSAGAPPAVLDTGLPVVTVGGLEDHPLFAEALYQRALDLSKRPDRETVILVAHGLGSEEGNAHWRRLLESIREQMLTLGGERFRAIEVGLWSEDWPELRQSAVEHMRGLVSSANEDDGRALVIPARTLGRGPAAEYLEGLSYVQGEGFSPHPLFADWLRVQVKAGLGRLNYELNETWDCGR
jgi:sirohydrochlorin ferrochelatase